MDLDELNAYLARLHGQATVEKINVQTEQASGSLKIKFNGDIGTRDNGEIEVEFLDVDFLSLAFSLVGPIKIVIANELVSSYLNQNYLERSFNFYQLIDDVGVKWWIYAKNFRAKKLPPFYK